ncbi:unnamed protein product [Pieris brassicae]|uniref:NADH dehydrogenase [ubiquinone] 1 alpha subcomplex subunit 7 n=1 Tax=Pieris brassicae TaxID=7116 RepID=A0A9P0TA67_PIEBR|nr:unnamed protein product [Pieris brassicae]
MGTKVRDVGAFLQKIRAILLGREHNLHGRFPPYISPRTIPPPEITRCPDYKYSNQYYHERNAFHSVHPPVVAPIAEGPPLKIGGPGPLKSDAICFNSPPTPGPAWWWDGHCYYECAPDPPPLPVKQSKTIDRHTPCPPPPKE